MNLYIRPNLVLNIFELFCDKVFCNPGSTLVFGGIFKLYFSINLKRSFSFLNVSIIIVSNLVSTYLSTGAFTCWLDLSVLQLKLCWKRFKYTVFVNKNEWLLAKAVFIFLLEGTLMQIWKSLPKYLCSYKIIPWKFRILDRKNSRVICQWSL